MTVKSIKKYEGKASSYSIPRYGLAGQKIAVRVISQFGEECTKVLET